MTDVLWVHFLSRHNVELIMNDKIVQKFREQNKQMIKK